MLLPPAPGSWLCLRTGSQLGLVSCMFWQMSSSLLLPLYGSESLS